MRRAHGKNRLPFIVWFGYLLCGRWLRIYKKSDIHVTESFDNWKQIYVLPDAETDQATEKEWEIQLSDYLQQHNSVLYYLLPDEKIVHAVDKASSKALYSYILEEFWYPSAEA